MSKKPYLGIHATHNIVNDTIANSKGIIEYDILLERPISEPSMIETVFLCFSFPTPIEKYTIINSVGTKNFTVKEGNKTTFLFGPQKQLEYSNDLFIEEDELKPGCFCRVKAYSPIMEKRTHAKRITCSGYYNYLVSGSLFKEKVSVVFEPRFRKIMEDIDLKKWRLIQEMIQGITPDEGTLMFSTDDSYWLERNNFIIDFIPYIRKEDFSLKIFRDKDNIFKCEIANMNHPKVILQYGDLEKVKEDKESRQHVIAVTWKDREKKLYLDGLLVDSFPKGIKE